MLNLQKMKVTDLIQKGNENAVTGNYKLAINFYKKVIKIDPKNVIAWGNLGSMQEKIGQDEEALYSIKKAIEYGPDYEIGLYNLALLLIKLKRSEEALVYLDRAISLNPNKIDAHFNKGIAMQRLGNTEEQLKSFEKVLQIKPDYPDIMNRLWFLYRQVGDFGKAEKLEFKLGQGHDPFISLVKSEDPKENLEVAKKVSGKLSGFALNSKIKFKYSKSSKIRLGYFSNDLKEHPVGQMVSSMFKHHDRNKFEVVALSYGKDDGGEIRKTIKKNVDEFVDLSGRMTDFEMAKIINSKKIDILIEMTGYTKDTRLGVASFRPAPIQLHFLGFPGTLGADFIDYAIVDEIVVPKNEQIYFTEKLLYLPRCYQVNSEVKILDKIYKREDFGLPKTGFVFGSFNQIYKIDKTIFTVWMNILKRVPESVLWLLNQFPECEINLKKEAKRQGVDPKRIIFGKHMPKSEHLGRLKLTDLGLDTINYGGHTTTTDYLWSGVPVITKFGSHFASRVCSSILSEVGLNELIVKDLEAYEDLAVELSNNPKKLNKYKAIITQSNLKTNLFDTSGFVKDLEKIYTKIYARYHRKKTN